MSKPSNHLIKKALEFFYRFTEEHPGTFLYHDYRNVSETVRLCKEIGKGEGLDKDEYELGLVALILIDLGKRNASATKIDNATLIACFFKEHEVSEADRTTILSYIEFLRSDKTPLTPVEKVIRDGKDIHLGLPDAIERLTLLQQEEEKLSGQKFTEMEWLQRCRQYFITHNFDTAYAISNFSHTRSKNYIELEKRIDRHRNEDLKEKKNHDKQNGHNALIDKDNEDLFKIAFRNYINLIALADSKAGLLIQVNSILASVVVALVLRKLESSIWFALPTGALLAGSAITIFYSILASKPLERWSGMQDEPAKEEFFFGSFDRLDPRFKDAEWSKYLEDMTRFFGGDKKFIFEDLIKESYEVRKVLSKKFNYLSIAYKVFFAGLLLSILGFIIVILHDVSHKDETPHNTPYGDTHSHAPFSIQNLLAVD